MDMSFLIKYLYLLEIIKKPLTLYIQSEKNLMKMEDLR